LRSNRANWQGNSKNAKRIGEDQSVKNSSVRGLVSPYSKTPILPIVALKGCNARYRNHAIPESNRNCARRQPCDFWMRVVSTVRSASCWCLGYRLKDDSSASFLDTEQSHMGGPTRTSTRDHWLLERRKVLDLDSGSEAIFCPPGMKEWVGSWTWRFSRLIGEHSGNQSQASPQIGLFRNGCNLQSVEGAPSAFVMRLRQCFSRFLCRPFVGNNVAKSAISIP